MSGQAFLTVGMGHQVTGDIDALGQLQHIMVKGDRPVGLDALHVAQDRAPITGGDAKLTVGFKDGRQLMVTGLIPAIMVAQAWVLANLEMVGLASTRCAT